MKIEQRIGCRLLGAASVLLSSRVVSHALQCKHFLYSTNVPHSFHVPLVFAVQSPFRCKCGMQYRPRVSRNKNWGRERSSLKLPLVRRKQTKKHSITWKAIFMRHSHTSLRWEWRDWSRRMLEKRAIIFFLSLSTFSFESTQISAHSENLRKLHQPAPIPSSTFSLHSFANGLNMSTAQLVNGRQQKRSGQPRERKRSSVNLARRFNLNSEQRPHRDARTSCDVIFCIRYFSRSLPSDFSLFFGTLSPRSNYFQHFDSWHSV